MRRRDRGAVVARAAAIVGAGTLLLLAAAQESPLDHLIASCHGGDGNSCDRAGTGLSQLTNDAKQDEQAYDCFRRGCELGVRRACRSEGKMEHDGRGVPKSRTLALASDDTGCSLGDTESCNAAAHLEIQEAAVPSDRVAGVPYLERGCQLGSIASCRWLGDLGETGWPSIPEDAERARRAFSAACGDGNAGGCARWGRLLACGDGEHRDLFTGERLLRSACQRNDTAACLQLARFIEAGLGSHNLDDPDYQIAWVMAAEELAIQDPDGDRLQTVLEHLRELDPDDVEPFIDACLALNRGTPDLPLLMRLVDNRASDQPGFPILRGLVTAREGGKAWGAALDRAWSEAGSPDLRDTGWFTLQRPSPGSMVPCYLADPPDSEAEPPGSTERFARRVIAMMELDPLHPRPSHALISQAMVTSGEDDLSALLAISVLDADALDSTGRSAALQHADRLRGELAARHPESAFFGSLPLCDSEHQDQPLDRSAMALLSHLRGLPLAPPHQALLTLLQASAGNPGRLPMLDPTGILGWSCLPLRARLNPVGVDRAALADVLLELGRSEAVGGWGEDAWAGADLIRRAGELDGRDDWAAEGKAVVAHADQTFDGDGPPRWHAREAWLSWPIRKLVIDHQRLEIAAGASRP